jgi:hypothetical protein
VLEAVGDDSSWKCSDCLKHEVVDDSAFRGVDWVATASTTALATTDDDGLDWVSVLRGTCGRVKSWRYV